MCLHPSAGHESLENNRVSDHLHAANKSACLQIMPCMGLVVTLEVLRARACDFADRAGVADNRHSELRLRGGEGGKSCGGEEKLGLRWRLWVPQGELRAAHLYTEGLIAFLREDKGKDWDLSLGVAVCGCVESCLQLLFCSDTKGVIGALPRLRACM